jgi:hypothetical protein
MKTEPTIDRGGRKLWYEKNKLHRLDGPAVEYADGLKLWYVNDKLHRLDGPARESPDGSKEWWVNNELHRLDGPAFDWPDSPRWFIAGQHLTQPQFERHPLVIFYRLSVERK